MIVVLMVKYKELKPSQFWVGLNSFLAIVLSVVSGSIVPEQFLRDSSYFDQILSSSVSGFSGPVSLIGSIYSFIGIHTPGVTLRLVSAGIFIVNVHIIFKYFDLKLERKTQYFTTSLCFLLIPFYGSGYSKELLVAIANISILGLLYRFESIRFLYFPLVSILIALTLRPYYLLTLLFFAIMFLTLNHIRTVAGRITFIVLILSTVITAEYHTRLILEISGFNILNVRATSQSVLEIAARSQIEQVELTGSFLHNLLAVLQVIRSMIFPYSELDSSLYLVAAFGINLVVWGIVVKSLSVVASRDGATTKALASFILAFVMTATFFEVDAGSFVRHFFPYLPLGVIILQSVSKKRERILPFQATWDRFH